MWLACLKSILFQIKPAGRVIINWLTSSICQLILTEALLTLALLFCLRRTFFCLCHTVEAFLTLEEGFYFIFNWMLMHCTRWKDQWWIKMFHISLMLSPNSVTCVYFSIVSIKTTRSDFSSESVSLLSPQLDLHAIRFRSQSCPEDWSEVRFSCILRPGELKLPQQSHRDEEKLHASQALSQTHPRTWDTEQESSSIWLILSVRGSSSVTLFMHVYLQRKAWRPLVLWTLPGRWGSFQGWIHEGTSTVPPHSAPRPGSR